MAALTFVVEDGTGKSDAHMYVSVLDTDAYFLRHGSPAVWLGTKAQGRLTLVENPTDDDTIVLGGTTFTFKTTVTIPTTQILIGADLVATTSNLIAFITLTADTPVDAFEVAPGIIDFEYEEEGTIGNAYTTTETFTASGNVFDAGTLGTQQAGVNPTLNTQEKGLALQRAAVYIDTVYGPRFCGYRADEDQALEWPRKDVYTPDGYSVESNTLPPEIIEANQLMALKYAEGTDPIPDLATPGNVDKEFIKLGPLASLKEFSDGKGQFTRFTQIEKLLNPYTRGIGTPVERG